MALIPLKSSTRSSPFFTAFMLGIAVAIIAAIVWRLSDPVESEVITEPKILRSTIGGQQFFIPGNMFRFRVQRKNRNPERVDLFFRWPELEGFTKFNAATFEKADARELIFLTIESKDSILAPEDRLRTIYKRFLSAPLTAPDGLLGKKFLDGSGYDGEELFYQEGGPQPFIARCIAEDTPDIPSTCLREIKMGPKTYMIYSFRRQYLRDWRSLDEAIRTAFVK